MRYLLDTNPCVLYLNGRSDALRRRIDAAGDDQLVVCSIVCAELFFGAAKSISPEKTLKLQTAFLARFRSLPFDEMAARAYGPIRAEMERCGAVIGAHDLLIAAIAVANNVTLVTHNIEEFRRVPTLVIEDWEAKIETA